MTEGIVGQGAEAKENSRPPKKKSPPAEGRLRGEGGEALREAYPASPAPNWD